MVEQVNYPEKKRNELLNEYTQPLIKINLLFGQKNIISNVGK